MAAYELENKEILPGFPDGCLPGAQYLQYIKDTGWLSASDIGSESQSFIREKFREHLLNLENLSGEDPRKNWIISNSKAFGLIVPKEEKKKLYRAFNAVYCNLHGYAQNLIKKTITQPMINMERQKYPYCLTYGNGEIFDKRATSKAANIASETARDFARWAMFEMMAGYSGKPNPWKPLKEINARGYVIEGYTKGILFVYSKNNDIGLFV